MSLPLLPRATAVWLVQNTGLSFRQIAEFCGLHEMEIEGIADGEVAQTIKGIDPVSTGQLTREEIARCTEDWETDLQLAEKKYDVPVLKKTAGPRYTPVSRRRDRPDAILWLVRNHPELSDGQIGKLIGTTKSTIVAVRNRTHWNSTNIKPVDPVSLGLCKQEDLDAVLAKAAKKAQRKAAIAESAPTPAPEAAEETPPVMEEKAPEEKPVEKAAEKPAKKPEKKVEKKVEEEPVVNPAFASLKEKFQGKVSVKGNG